MTSDPSTSMAPRSATVPARRRTVDRGRSPPARTALGLAILVGLFAGVGLLAASVVGTLVPTGLLVLVAGLIAAVGTASLLPLAVVRLVVALLPE